MLNVVSERRAGRKTYCAVICQCGHKYELRKENLKFRTKCAGCMAGCNATHGHTRGDKPSGAYSSWLEMRRRCLDPGRPAFADYGGRGIKICDRWLNFGNFYNDMGDRPPGKSLDRYPNNDGDYEPGNCRWATPKEQANNRRKARRTRWSQR